MKLIPMFALAAAASIAVASYASAAACNRPASVQVPDGKSAEEAAMKAANGKVVAYVKEANAYIKCLQAEEKSAVDEAKKTNDDYQAAVKAYNETPAK